MSEALNSLAAQSRIVDEIIVWDDGSEDDTEKTVRAAAGPVRYFRSENGGKSRALNAAIAQARGDWIWICDDDDIALPHAAETLSALLLANPSAGFAAGGYKRFSNAPETGEPVLSGPGYWPDLSEGSVLRHLLEDIFLFQNATLVRRSCYEAVGPFREDLARSIDYDMIVRLAARFPAAVIETPLFHQRKHSGARGPAAARHAASRSEEVWKGADKLVFEGLLEALQPDLFTNMFEAAVPGHAARAGRLQRGCVFARRTDWQVALQEFRAAAALVPGMALSPVEKTICRRALAGKHGCAEALRPDVRGALAGLAAGSPLGAEIAAALARGTGWRLRAAVRGGDLRVAAALLGFASRLLVAGRQRRPRLAAGRLAERCDYPEGGAGRCRPDPGIGTQKRKSPADSAEASTPMIVRLLPASSVITAFPSAVVR
ncbi:glycosyltransferase [Leisingera sp. NJS201]|uniref:glycosyltransferase n=1 Tax=Leisingera sp. NJS201 TaxID=2508306 RepID=UPI0020C74846|nr:glycosyltransferase [Leisingera sp. NJS201]